MLQYFHFISYGYYLVCQFVFYELLCSIRLHEMPRNINILNIFPFFCFARLQLGTQKFVSVLRCTMWPQYVNITDGRTDKRTDVQTNYDEQQWRTLL